MYNIYYRRSFFNSDLVPTLSSAAGQVTNLCNPSDPVSDIGSNKGRNARRGRKISLVERIAVIQEHQSGANVCQ